MENCSTPPYEEITTVFGIDEEDSALKRRRKRRSLGRRVSFADAPAYHIYTRDDEYVSPSHNRQDAQGSAPQKTPERRSPRLASKRQAADSADKENWRPVSKVSEDHVRRRSKKPLSNVEPTIFSPASRPPSWHPARNTSSLAGDDGEISGFVDTRNTSWRQKERLFDEDVTLDSTTFTFKLSQLHNLKTQPVGDEDMLIEPPSSTKRNDGLGSWRESPTSGSVENDMSFTMIKPIIRPKIVHLHPGHIDGNTDMSITMQIQRKHNCFLGIDASKQAEFIEIVKATLLTENADGSASDARLADANSQKSLRVLQHEESSEAAPTLGQIENAVTKATDGEVQEESVALSEIPENEGRGKLLSRTAVLCESEEDRATSVTTVDRPERLADVLHGRVVCHGYEGELPGSLPSREKTDVTEIIDSSVSTLSASVVPAFEGYVGLASEADHKKSSSISRPQKLVQQEGSVQKLLAILSEEKSLSSADSEENILKTSYCGGPLKQNTVFTESEDKTLIPAEISWKDFSARRNTAATIAEPTQCEAEKDNMSSPDFTQELEKVSPGSTILTMDMSVSPTSTVSLAHGECKQPVRELDRSITMDIPSLQNLVQEEEDEDMVTDMNMDTEIAEKGSHFHRDELDQDRSITMGIPRLEDIIREEEEDDTVLEGQKPAADDVLLPSLHCGIRNTLSSSDGDFSGSITAQGRRCSDLLPRLRSSPKLQNVTPTSGSVESMDIVTPDSILHSGRVGLAKTPHQVESRTPNDSSGQMVVFEDTAQFHITSDDTQTANIVQDYENKGSDWSGQSMDVVPEATITTLHIDSSKLPELSQNSGKMNPINGSGNSTKIVEDASELKFFPSLVLSQFSARVETSIPSADPKPSLAQTLYLSPFTQSQNVVRVAGYSTPSPRTFDAKELINSVLKSAARLATTTQASFHQRVASIQSWNGSRKSRFTDGAESRSPQPFANLPRAPAQLLTVLRSHEQELRECKRLLEDNYKHVLNLQGRIQYKAEKGKRYPPDRAATEADEEKIEIKYALDKIKYLKEQLADVSLSRKVKIEKLLKRMQITEEAWRRSKERLKSSQSRFHDLQMKLAENVRIGHSQAGGSEIAARPDFYVKEMVNKVSLLKALQGEWQVRSVGHDMVELSYPPIISRRLVVAESLNGTNVTKSTWGLDLEKIELMFPGINAVAAFQKTLNVTLNDGADYVSHKPQSLHSCIQGTRFLVNNFLMLMEEVGKCQNVRNSVAGRGVLIIARFQFENDKHMQLEIKFLDCLLSAKFILTLDLRSAQLNGYPFGAMPAKVDIKHCPTRFSHKLTSAALEDAIAAVEPGHHRVERLCATVGSLLATVKT